MAEVLFMKSSYSTGENNCIEASAPDGFRFSALKQRCGDVACQTVVVSDELTMAASDYSNAEGNCIEAGGIGDRIFVRDSKIDTSPLISASPEAFMAFTTFAASQAVEFAE